MAMTPDKPLNRLTLRQIMSQSEKCSRDLIEMVQTHFLARLNEFRDLSRVVRRRSHYPHMNAVANSLRKLMEASAQTMTSTDHLREHLEAIRDHAQRERVSRL